MSPDDSRHRQPAEHYEEQIDPVVVRWLRENQDEQRLRALLDVHPLNALLSASRTTASPLPDDVLRSWHRRLAEQRVVLHQSEVAFIEAARRSGLSWSRIAEVLGLPDAATAEGRADVLRDSLRRRHPSNLPVPHTG